MNLTTKHHNVIQHHSLQRLQHAACRSSHYHDCLKNQSMSIRIMSIDSFLCVYFKVLCAFALIHGILVKLHHILNGFLHSKSCHNNIQYKSHQNRQIFNAFRQMRDDTSIFRLYGPVFILQQVYVIYLLNLCALQSRSITQWKYSWWRYVWYHGVVCTVFVYVIDPWISSTSLVSACSCVWLKWWQEWQYEW